MSEWKEFILEKVCNKITDGSHFSPKLLSDGIRIIATVKDMGEYDFEYSKCKKISEEEYQSLLKNDCKPLKNDILFSKDGTIGKIIVFDGKMDLVILSSIAILRPNIDLVNPKLLAYYLKSEKSQNEINENYKSGSVIPRVILKDFKRFPISLPSLPTQTAIAEILSSLDDKIELNNKINQELEALAQTLFKQWFLDFEFPNENGEPYKSSGGEMVDSELGEIPKGCEVGTLDDILEVKGGTTPSTNEPSFWNGDVHWTSPKDLSNLKSPLLLETEKKITELGLGKISSGLLPKGTLLLSSRAPIGYLAITEIETAINQGYIAINGRKEYSNLYILNWLKLNMDLVIARANGSTFLEISKTNFKQIKCVLPHLGVLKSYTLQIENLFNGLINNTKENNRLTNLRDTLLPKLISGELEINEISN